ncbi:MAG: L,D-transpeptidase, partial [Chlamydiota bacterium]
MTAAAMTLEASRKWEVSDKEQLQQYKEICEEVREDATDALTLVNTSAQTLHLVVRQKFHCSFTVSTSKKGEGSIEGSGMTPLGLHTVIEKYGDGADPFAVFKSRVATGEIA